MIKVTRRVLFHKQILLPQIILHKYIKFHFCDHVWYFYKNISCFICFLLAKLKAVNLFTHLNSHKRVVFTFSFDC